MFRFGILVAVAVLLLDQLTKWVILEHVMDPPRVVEVTGFFNLVLVGNRGVSFGMFSSDSAWSQPLLAGFALCVAVGLAVWLRRERSRFVALALGLVIGGAIGNAIDRFAHGAVVDFLDVHALGWHWPAFNVADSGISVGVVLIVLDGLFAAGSKTK